MWTTLLSDVVDIEKMDDRKEQKIVCKYEESSKHQTKSWQLTYDSSMAGLPQLFPRLRSVSEVQWDVVPRGLRQSLELDLEARKDWNSDDES